MSLSKAVCLYITFALISITCYARTIKVLFVGNSFTYQPGEEVNPGLPKYFVAIAKDLGIDIEADSVVRGGQTLKGHYYDGRIQEKLDNNKYDYVVLQAQSVEALVLPKCFLEKEDVAGREEFLEYSKKLMDLVVANGAIPILMSHWTYQASHPWLKDDFICARFADDEENAGQRWFGNNLEEYQQALNQGFRLAAKQEPTARISWVGDRWQRVINDPYQLITSGMLYQNDHKHPDMYGTFFNALILAHDILDVDVKPATYRPPHVTLDEFEYLKFNASF